LNPNGPCSIMQEELDKMAKNYPGHFKMYYVLNKVFYALDVLRILVHERHCPTFFWNAQKLCCKTWFPCSPIMFEILKVIAEFMLSPEQGFGF
jgi:hypothetical protein